MALREYHRRRDFKKTPEPKGGGKAASPGRQFVVQKHAARRLHYDFRLELDGVLKSWAIPKGPSLDPSVKSLAVHVEDHPLEYGTFEGIIPRGEYGGGTVMVWDRGTWEPEGDPQKAFKKGSLKFRLHGEKLRGAWTLVRMGGKAGEDGKNWLLIKKEDDAARPANKYDVLAKAPRSVLSGRDLETIAEDADRVWSKNGEETKTGRGSTPSPAAAKQRASRSPRQSSKGRPDGGINPASVPGARKGAMLREFKPQLATLVQKVPESEEWLHEIKFDGYRILAFLDGGKVRLITRNGNDWTGRFSGIGKQIAKLPIEQAVLDGEVVSLTKEGTTSFQQLQNWLKRGKSDELVYYAFDLVYLNGYDLTRGPLVDRKALLARLVLSAFPENDGPIRYSDHIQGQGPTVVEHTCRHALEGVISKKADSAYQQGRSRQWLKIKCLKRQEFVIGGYTKPSGSRQAFGALLLGYYDGDELKYCGRVGTGFTDESLRQILTELKARKTDSPPFSDPPTGGERRGITWVRPDLVCEVEFTEWTEADTRRAADPRPGARQDRSSGARGKTGGRVPADRSFVAGAGSRLRHPSFQGLREDKPAAEVRREDVGLDGGPPSDGAATAARRNAKTAARPAARRSSKVSSDSADSIAGVRLTNPDRVLYPQQGITKRDLAKFYESIAEWVLPSIVDRPLTLVRCPQGRSGKCFYQKHLTESMPGALRGVFIEEKKKREEYVVVDDLAGLISLVQMGVLEMHPWPARTDDLEHPDQLVFDLDPGEGTTWEDVVQGARDVRDRLKQHGLESFLRTSGGKGLHVVAPLDRHNTWDEFKEFAKTVAVEMEREWPKRYTSNMSKAKRRGKIFVDYLRNQRGATAVASYSTRAREGAPVATPVRWDELSPQLAADKYTVKNLPRRLSSLKIDPWADFFKMKQSFKAGR